MGKSLHINSESGPLTSGWQCSQTQVNSPENCTVLRGPGERCVHMTLEGRAGLHLPFLQVWEVFFFLSFF